MKAIWWVVVLGSLGVWWTAWRLIRYPGGWAYAFHEEHQEHRQALADARSAVRELRGTARRETWQARTEVKRAEWAYRRRIRQVESELQQLRTPHRGALVKQLGEIALHENSVLIGDEEMQLVGMQVRFDLAQSTHVSYVYLTQPDGRQHMERYEGQEFPEDAVRRFSVQIQNAAAAAQRLSERRAGDIRTLEAELREAQEATEPVDVAQERLEKTRARHSADLKLPRAREALDDARQEWQDLTGRRPL
ncbi:hypothetical protein NRF20_01630 [Streptomyces sp. R-74717]|uniref:hypothetical protein n=1 Tax=Streptomyces TaxID=1883 RepID=UPI0037BB20E4